MPVKKKIIVVKSLRDVSPKRQLLVSRKPFENEESDQFESSKLGNTSPAKPQRTKDGNLLQRSILGDSAMFDVVDRKKRQEGALDTSGTGVPGSRGTSSDRRTSSAASKLRGAKTALVMAYRAHHIEEPDEILEESVEYVNLTERPDKYIETLRRQQTHANKLQMKTMDQQEVLMKYLPAHERFNLNKEGKVLTRWQERMRNWDRIEAHINKRINTRSSHTLLMTSTDDFRARKEEYEMLQVARSDEERFGPNGWRMSLRGGASMSVTIGHIFSGLECEVDRPIRVPPMIRKPRPTGTYTLGTSFLEETPTLIHKRKTIAKELTRLRPHVVSYEDAEHLVIQSSDLFSWAIDSSNDYFKDIESRKLAEEEAVLSIADMKRKGEEAHVANKNATTNKNDLSAKNNYLEIDFMTTQDVVFETDSGKTVYRNVVFKNISASAINYSWTRLIPGDDNPSSEIATAFDSMGSHIHREYKIKKLRSHFTCVREEGLALPGETVSTMFGFGNKPIAGIFEDSWILQTTPRVSVSFSISDSERLQGERDGVRSSEPLKKIFGPVTVRFHGYASEVDESQHARLLTAQTLDKKVQECLARDEIEKCLNRVRTPVRMSTVKSRLYSVFERINADLIAQLRGDTTVPIPIYINDTRLAEFTSLYERAVQMNVTISERLLSLRMKLDLPPRELAAGDPNDNSCVYQILGHVEALKKLEGAHCNADLLATIKAELFPELNIEIFDEIIDEQITPTWDYSINRIIEGLESSIRKSKEIKDFETILEKRVKDYGKAFIKQSRVDARNAIRDKILADAESDDDIEDLNLPDEEDDEDEDEDEEEEQDIEALDLEAQRKHVLTVKAEQLLEECRGTLVLLITEPLPVETLESTLSSNLCSMLFDNFDHFHESALVTSGLAKFFVLPQIHSPFAGTGGAEHVEQGRLAWTNALHSVAPPDPAAAPITTTTTTKAPAAPAKGAKVVITPEMQTNQFYGTLHKLVKEAILDVMNTTFGTLDLALNTIVDTFTGDSPDVINTAALRPEDISTDWDAKNNGKIIFVNFPGEFFLPNLFSQTGCKVQDSEGKKALREIKHMGEAGASAIVLLYESQSLSRDHDSLLGKVDIMNEYMKKLVLEEGNTLNKAMRVKLRREDLLRELPETIVNISFDFKSCSNIAELNKTMQVISKTPKFTNANAQDDASVIKKQRKKRRKTRKPPIIIDNIIPVYVLENINKTDVIPPEPALLEYHSDNEDAPVSIGSTEFINSRLQAWKDKRPHKVTFPITYEGNRISVDCFADAWSSIESVYKIASNSAYGALWVDSSLNSIFQSADLCAMQTVSPMLDGQKFASSILREALLWCGVLQQVRNSSSILSSAAGSEENLLVAISALSINEEATATAVNSSAEPSPPSPVYNPSKEELVKSLPSYFSYLFPNVKNNAVSSIAIFGGALRENKFSVLDRLIGLVDTVYICGELCLPFISYIYSIVFKKYSSQCIKYLKVCRHILFRARARGVKLVFPKDFTIGDETINVENIISSLANSPPGASLDEGVDYEGEVKVVDMLSAADIDGYVYDIGPESCVELREYISKAGLVLVWGTVGLCEVSSFQTGQRALVEALARKPYDEREGDEDAHSKSKPQSIVIGDKGVDWFARIVDSDGERGGTLVETGIVSYACRYSSIVTGVLCRIQSYILQGGIMRRSPKSGEWIYNAKPLPELEEEEDDE